LFIDNGLHIVLCKPSLFEKEPGQILSNTAPQKFRTITNISIIIDGFPAGSFPFACKTSVQKNDPAVSDLQK
jgi:hypothetical protein